MIEAQLLSHEPAIQSLIIKEVDLLIDKLKAMITGYSPTAGAIATPVMSAFSAIANTAITKTTDALVAQLNKEA
jgi:hypothetical protein